MRSRLFAIAWLSLVLPQLALASLGSCELAAERLYAPIGYEEFNGHQIAFDARCTADGIDVCVYHDRYAVHVLGQFDHHALDYQSQYDRRGDRDRHGNYVFEHVVSHYDRASQATSIFGFIFTGVYDTTGAYVVDQSWQWTLARDFSRITDENGRSAPCSRLDPAYIPADFPHMVSSARLASGGEIARGSLITLENGTTAVVQGIFELSGNTYAIPDRQLRSRLYVDEVMRIRQQISMYVNVADPAVKLTSPVDLWKGARPAHLSDIDTSASLRCTLIGNADVERPLWRFNLERGTVIAASDYGNLAFQTTPQGMIGQYVGSRANNSIEARLAISKTGSLLADFVHAEGSNITKYKAICSLR